MTGRYLAGEIQRRIMGPVLAFNDEIFSDVLKAFGNLDERAHDIGNEFFNNFPANEYTDAGDVADWARDHSISWYETMVSLRQSMRNLLAAGLFHLIEQQLAALSLDCAFERVRDTKLDVVNTWYKQNLGLNLKDLASWGTIDELRLIANSVKHAEGASAEQLRRLRPELFSDPDFADIEEEWAKRGLKLERRPVSAPLSGEDFFVTEHDLKAYSKAARSLFEGIVRFCEQHSDERFPRRV